jgi:hypothetical protein
MAFVIAEVGCVQKIQGQIVRYNRFIDDHGKSEGATSILEDTNCYYISGSGFSDTFNGWRALKIVKTDTAGSVIWMKLIGADSIGVYSAANKSIIKTYDGNFIVTGDYEDQRGGGLLAVPYLLKFNSFGDTLWMKTFPRGRSDYPNMCLETQDHGIAMLMLSNSYGFGNGDYVIVKTDSAGNFQWYKNYGGGGFDFPLGMELLTDKGFLITGGSLSFGSTSITYIVRTDSLGNLLWDRKIGASKNYCGGFVRAVNPNLNILCSCIKDSSILPTDDSTYIFYIAYTDSSLNFDTRYFYHNSEYFGLGPVEVLGGSSLYSYGQIHDDGSSFDLGLIVCYDFHGGKKWERQYYYGSSVYNMFNDSRATKDGGIILTGATFSIHDNEDYWLVKLDSFGCLSPGCQLHDGIVDLTQPKQHLGLNIYPNPVFDKATLVIENSSDYRGESASVVIYDVLGCEVFRTSYYFDGYLPQVPITLADKPPGLYSVRVSVKGEAFGELKLVKY